MSRAPIPPQELRLTIAIGLSIVAIFAFDIATPADDVSIAFMYVVPIFLSARSERRTAYLFAGVTTFLSVLGAFLLTPDAGWSLHGNRVIAILTQWIVAGFVLSRKKAEDLLHQNLLDARRKGERQKRFLDILSHEIGTSLTTIDGQAFRLARRSAKLTAEETVQRSGKIRNAVRDIQALIQHIQLASEVEDHVLQPDRTAVAVAPLIDEVVQQIRQTYPLAAVTAHTQGLTAMVWADAFMLRQIVENLVSNAAKYSPPGAPIAVTGEERNGQVVLTVADQGRGIAPEELSRVFSAYFRAPNSHDVHGTGVGLYVSKQFAAAHGGAIAIDSRLGAGTTVTLRIPISNPETAP